MKKEYKCPWCQYPFDRNELTPNPDRKYIYHCPNPATIFGSDNIVCQKPLPPNYLSSKSITIALAGDTFVGKSNYQMALLHELKNNKALFKLGIRGYPVGDKNVVSRIERNFQQMDSGEPLERTTQIEDPFLIQLDVRNGKKTKTVYFSFYDNPGGWFDDSDTVFEKMHNILYADGIIFLIDPIEIEHLWADVIKDNEYVRKSNRRPRGLLKPVNTLTQVLRQVKSFSQEHQVVSGGDSYLSRGFEAILESIGIYPNNKEIDIPVAFTISKFDQLRNRISETIPYDSRDMEAMCMKTKTGKYDDRIQKAISKDIEELLFYQEDSDVRLKATIEEYYSQADYFACKSVRVNEKTGKPEELQPQGVLLPLIWLLVKMGIYK